LQNKTKIHNRIIIMSRMADPHLRNYEKPLWVFRPIVSLTELKSSYSTQWSALASMVHQLLQWSI
jgi:hypothetical protein